MAVSGSEPPLPVGGARVPMEIDVGFGDAITPSAVDINYPTLLDGPAPYLRAYPAETVVAEKFEALVSLGLANSRMKDFYDLWLISQTFSFTDAGLGEAIRRTFERRRTDLPADVPTGLSDAFVLEKGGQWRAFLRRERLRAAPEAFDRLIGDLAAFLLPLLAEGTREQSWPAGGPWGRAST